MKDADEIHEADILLCTLAYYIDWHLK